MNKEEAFKIELSKWPQMVVNGEKTTKEQALNVIKRTDSAFSWLGFLSNNEEFNKQAAKIINKPDFKSFNNDWNAYDKAQDEWYSKWGFLTELEYLRNDWVSCCWIGGCHGWCHPDGTIAYRNNIGKWPSVEDVYNEWVIIAKEFPFLNLTCTLMDGEEGYCEKSLVTIKVKDGEVGFTDTIRINDLQMNGIPFNYSGIGLSSHENYFSLDQIQKWYDESFR